MTNLSFSGEWIHASERLPEHNRPVLVADESSDVAEAYLDGDGIWRSQEGVTLVASVLYWTEMPSFPILVS